MEKSTSTDFNLYVVCPHCNKLVDVGFNIKTGFKEAEPETKTEGKDNAGQEKTELVSNRKAESGDVRPDNPKGTTGTKDSVSEPTDSGKSKADKRTGGKTK